MGSNEQPSGVAASLALDRLMREATQANRSGDYARAGSLCSQILEIDPTFLPAKKMEAAHHLRAGRELAAEKALHYILEREPDSFQALMWLGQLTLDQRPEEAIPFADRAHHLRPRDVNALHLLARANFDAGNADDAQRQLREALALEEGFAEAHSLLGHILQQLGRVDEAETYLKRAMELAPLHGPTYFSYVQTRKTTGEDEGMVGRMEQVIADPRIEARDRGMVAYALGKAYDDLKRYEEAMSNYDVANQVFLAQLEATGRKFDRLRSESEFLKAASISEQWSSASSGSPSDLPILVVGMMRSGTTLMEQILSSHSQVGGAGEQHFWMDNAGTFQDAGRLPSAREATDLAGRYLERLAPFGEGKRHVVDKMPSNFITLGTFHGVFPNAKIVHCRRQLVNLCLSIYMTPFRSSPVFGHSKENLAYYARQYEALMAHWRKAFTSDQFYEVEYETLVAEPETEIRKLIEFLGLEWEDACLRQNQNPKAVATPSLWQVRQPIYKSSVERWRNYEPWLGALKELVEPEGVQGLNLNALLDEAEAAFRAKRYDEVGIRCQAILAADPNCFGALWLIGASAAKTGRLELAERALSHVLAINPVDRESLSLLGIVFQRQGRFEEAERVFERLRRVDPTSYAPYVGILRGRRAREEDRRTIAQAISFYSEEGRDPNERRQLAYAIGKSFDDLGDYAQAATYFEQANALAAAQQMPTPMRDVHLGRIEHMRRGITSRRLEESSSFGSEDKRPIFIVGMIRSGTTLVEQILSSHSEVAPGDEIRFWIDKGPAVIDGKTGAFDADLALRLSGEYSAYLERISKGAPHVTDKMPLNYLLLGLIHLLFPKAPIIHCRRDPADTCVSIYMTPFAAPPDFAYDRGEIEFAYEKYVELMSYWKEILPAGRVLDVDYESLIGSPEAEIRRILDYCGLDWDPSCLTPERNERAVNTPSRWQVRQPIYGSSIGRARHYPQWFRGLAK